MPQIGRLTHNSPPIIKGTAKFTTPPVPALGATHIFLRISSKVHNPVDTFKLLFSSTTDADDSVKTTAIVPGAGVDDLAGKKITDKGTVLTWALPSPCPYEHVFVRFNIGQPERAITDADLDYVVEEQPLWQPPPIPQPDIVDPVTGEVTKVPDVIPPMEPDPNWVRSPNKPLISAIKSPGLSITLTAWAA